MKNALDKLVSRGAAALEDEELVALLVAENQCDDQARGVARSIIAECGGRVSGIADIDISRLRMMSGIGKLRAARLKAAIELGGRVAQQQVAQRDVIASDADVVRVMRPIVGALQHEECWVLYLASSGRILERMRVSQGGVQATVVDCRLIIKRALELLAVQIVIVHNHPSGSAEPSGQDMALTERVAEAARLFEIRLLDHVIVAQAEHYSFRGHGLIK
jgi:DNA repair protein RadC